MHLMFGLDNGWRHQRRFPCRIITHSFQSAMLKRFSHSVLYLDQSEKRDLICLCEVIAKTVCDWHNCRSNFKGFLAWSLSCKHKTMVTEHSGLSHLRFERSKPGTLWSDSIITDVALYDDNRFTGKCDDDRNQNMMIIYKLYQSKRRNCLN